MKIAIIGAGLAGLATCYHLLSSKNSEIKIHVFDKHGIGKGASSIAAGLIHPYRRDYDRYIWNGKDAFQETLKLIAVSENEGKKVILQQGILKVATSLEEVELLSSLNNPDFEWWDEKMMTSNFKFLNNLPAVFIKSALSISPICYLQGLWSACQKNGATLIIEDIKSLSSLDEYDYVVVSAGSQIFKFPEASNLGINLVKGQILVMDAKDIEPLKYALNGGCYVVQKEPDSLIIGATYEHDFEDLKPNQKRAENELFPKLDKLSPILRKLPIKECLSEGRVYTKNHLPLVEQRNKKFWFFTGLGSRGLLYHAFLGKKIASNILESIQ